MLTSPPIPAPPGPARAKRNASRWADAPFSNPVLAKAGAWLRLGPECRSLIALIEAQPREDGVTVLNVTHACRVLRIGADELDRRMDDLHASRVVFFVSFGGSGGRSYFALKPHSQPGDLPMRTAQKLAERFEREQGGPR